MKKIQITSGGDFFLTHTVVFSSFIDCRPGGKETLLFSGYTLITDSRIDYRTLSN